MSTIERDIISNKTYIEQYYPFVKWIINEGGLTLLSPKYINLGYNILLSITKQLLFNELQLKGNEYTKVCRKEVVLAVEKELLPVFL